MFGINQLQQASDPNETQKLYDQAEKDRAAARKWWIFTGLVLVGAGIWEYQRNK